MTPHLHRAEAEDKVKALTREAEDIAASYDLKGVNPNKKPKIDARTPKGLLAVFSVTSERRSGL